MKTIIIYVSKYGYTEDCVKSLADQIMGEVILFNIYNEKIPNIDEFDNVIIGGSIYMGQIQKKLKFYCTQNINCLANKRLSLFLCCGLPESFEQTLKNSFPDELLKKAIAKECFGGELRTDRMNFADKMISVLMKNVAAKEGKTGVRQMPENIFKLAECMNNIRKREFNDEKI